MTLTLSPEVEADIRELLRLWGWDANDPLLAEATARAAMVNGLRSAIEMTREVNGARTLLMAQGGPAVEITCRVCRNVKMVFVGSKCHENSLCVDCYWDAQGIPAVQSVPDARVFEEADAKLAVEKANQRRVFEARVFEEAEYELTPMGKTFAAAMRAVKPEGKP